jgi:hypothetical protein
MDATQVLVQMLERFRGGRAWTQGATARNRYGRQVGIKSAEARKYCLVGAMLRELSALPQSEQLTLERKVTSRLQSVTESNRALVIWNDEQEGWGTVQAALRAAIEDGK